MIGSKMVFHNPHDSDCSVFQVLNKMADTTITSTTTEDEPQHLAGVPETLLKRRKNLERVRAARAAADLKKTTLVKQKKKRGEEFKRAEDFVKEFRQKERDDVRLQRMVKRTGPNRVPEGEVLGAE